MNLRRVCALLVLQLAAFAAVAAEPLPFKDAAQEARFRALTTQLRCVMCQNQSLADSNAPIAHDLRMEVFDLMQQGRSDDEIKAFLVERYTDFVLYRPPLDQRTWWLWFGPLALLGIGTVVVVGIVRRRARAEPAQAPKPEDAW